jgi:hypothetical protein
VFEEILHQHWLSFDVLDQALNPLRLAHRSHKLAVNRAVIIEAENFKLIRGERSLDEAAQLRRPWRGRWTGGRCGRRFIGFSPGDL